MIESRVGRVRVLFPGRSEEVSALALRSERFRGLCEDYGLAVETLERLEDSNRPQDIEKMIEYRALIKELKKEIEGEFLGHGEQGGAHR